MKSLPIDDISKKNILIANDEYAVIKGDSFKLLKRLPDKSIDVVFADPPYFLSGDGISCQAGKMVSVNKGVWDEERDIAEKIRFSRKWIKEINRVLNDSGTLWVSGTFHIIYAVAVAMEYEGFKIINNITWQKTNPPPNIACKAFTHSTETIIWARKNASRKYKFNYKEMKEENGGKQMKDVWQSALTPQKEKEFGKHPTQKPIFILDRIIKASSDVGDIILDPFSGSFTTGVAALKLGRRFIGIEKEQEYIDIGLKRLKTESEVLNVWKT